MLAVPRVQCGTQAFMNIVSTASIRIAIRSRGTANKCLTDTLTLTVLVLGHLQHVTVGI